ncbi:MAG: hypothetical protein HYS86_03480 [Candidatus Chisholmbacteria bacterium]|nr:hypothetical protein [Candidatus Chisholmbacteria bacterium]
MLDYEVRLATREDVSSLVALQSRVRSLAAARGELPTVDLKPALEVDATLVGVLSDADRMILVAEVDGEIRGKGHLNFYPDKGVLTLSSFEVDSSVEGLRIAGAFLKEGVRMARERYPQIQILRIGRYNRSEDYRRRGLSRRTFFDWMAAQSGVVVEEDSWEGEPMRWYNVPFATVDNLMAIYEKLYHRFPIT